jgi:hypothetical protein
VEEKFWTRKRKHAVNKDEGKWVNILPCFGFWFLVQEVYFNSPNEI